MKKFILLLFGVSLSIIGASALNLRDVYYALSNLPNVSPVVNDTVLVMINNTEKYYGTVQESRAVGLDNTEVFNTGNATYAILDQIPLSYMINGGNNGYVAAFVYSTPNEDGTNDVLVVSMSGPQGNLSYRYVTNVDDENKTALINAKLIMQRDSLSLIPESACFFPPIKINCE